MKNRIYKVISALLMLASVFSFSGKSVGAADGSVQISSRFGELIFGKQKEEKTLLVSGGIFGAKIKQSYVSIVEAKGVHGLRAGDIIVSVSGNDISEAADVEEILLKSGGEPIAITVKRGDSLHSVVATPKLSGGKYKLGIKLKDTSSGIGTITFIDKEKGIFGGLGHGICDVESGELVAMTDGVMTGVLLGGVNRGEAGKPGELCGVLTGKVTGSIYKNSECGVFGEANFDDIDVTACEELQVASAAEVHIGEAEILCTVKNGSPRRYKIEITEITDNSSPTKSFKVHVTDKTLIAITGGIVRGMSGSPIIQDGKLIGALTHVMVADPTEGYGIFIENMLNASDGQSAQKAA